MRGHEGPPAYLGTAMVLARGSITRAVSVGTRMAHTWPSGWASKPLHAVCQRPLVVLARCSIDDLITVAP